MGGEIALTKIADDKMKIMQNDVSRSGVEEVRARTTSLPFSRSLGSAVPPREADEGERGGERERDKA